MAAFKVGKLSNINISKRWARDLFLTFTRNKNSRYLGYYMRKLSTPVFRKRQEDYRKTVLKPLEEIPTLEDRLKVMNAPDPVLDVEIDIGFMPKNENKVSVKDRLEWRKMLASLNARYYSEGEIRKVDIFEIEKDSLEYDRGSILRNIAKHYGIFKDLYEHGVFTPCIPLDITYDFDEKLVNPVHTGNILQASDATRVPNVNFKSSPDDLWTLILTNLDGHLLDNNSEYLHWFVGNIKGNNLKSGEVICDYLQPFPMKGTGYHRLVFVLYKQEKRIDFSSLKKKIPCVSLPERTFKTFDFYKEHQDMITPAGLSFFQCTWDETLTDFFHNVLNMQEPVFEYMDPPVHVKEQVHFPHLEYFNVYLDRYRDPKELNKDVLLKRLKMVEPFKEDAPMPKYPFLHKPEGYKFSWQREDLQLQRLRLGKYRDLRPHSVYHQEDNQSPFYTKWDLTQT